MRTLAAKHTFEQDIKKSRFIATALRADSPEEALAAFAKISHINANHNCWAYRIGQDYRFNDDGEPGGSAGRPILAAIEGRDLDRVAVLVTRYFGGIKLGKGGLVRAYGGTAAKCLEAAPVARLRPKTRVRVSLPFDALGGIHTLLNSLGAQKVKEDYTSRGVDLELVVETNDLARFDADLKSLLRGGENLEILETFVA